MTSVGGTQFYPSYAGINGVPLYGQAMGTDVGFLPEGVWDVLSGPAAGASGGGESQYFTKPNYQVLSTPPDGARDVPDVALMAGALDANGVPNPGAFYADDPQISGSYCPGPGACIACCVGGTSLATVLWAGVSKLIQQQLGARIGNINPELYSLAGLGYTAGLRDVTVNASPNNNGFNGVTGWPAENGYDLATGWGSPDITTLVNLFGSKEVVLLGGATATENLQTGEAYNPATQSFTSLGAIMSKNRVDYGTAKLPDGTILLAGGDTGAFTSILKTADIFNSITNTYTATTNKMADAYFDFAQAVTLETGRTSKSSTPGVFIIGTTGSGNDSLWTEIYDPPTQSFSTPVKPFKPSGSAEPQVGYTTTLLGNGKVLIQGFTSTAQLYDPIAKTFTETTNQPPEVTIPGGQLETLFEPAAVLLSNGMVLVAGGYAATIYPSSFAYLYNPATNTFAATGSLNRARCNPAAYALPNGEAMVMGPAGENNVAGSCYIDNTVEIYNPGTGAFTLAYMTTARDNPFVSIIPNSGNPANLTAQVLMAGGANSTSFLDSAETYDPVFGTFTALTETMTTPSAGGAGFPFALPAR